MVQVRGELVVDALHRVVPKWGAEPEVLRNGDVEQASSLLGLKALDALLADVRIPEDMYQVMVSGRADSPRRYSVPVRLEDHVVFRALEPSLAYAALAGGASLLIAGVSELWPPVRKLCATVTKESGLVCSAFAFVSPAKARGFVPHIDRTDQLVIQCAGSKDWKVYEVVADHNLRGKRIEEQNLGRITFEGTLGVGDMLYIPVGAPHVAFASTEFSTHLTLIFEPVTLDTTIRGALESLLSEDPQLTRPLPPFYRDDEGGLVSSVGNAAAGLALRLPDRSERCLKAAISDQASRSA